MDHTDIQELSGNQIFLSFVDDTTNYGVERFDTRAITSASLGPDIDEVLSKASQDVTFNASTEQSSVHVPAEDIKEESTQEKYQCTHCTTFTATTEDLLQQHIQTDHNENPYTCSLCKYTTEDKTKYEEHHNMHKGLKPYKCSQCNHRTASKTTLRIHEKSHNDATSQHKCKKCNYTCRTKIKLEKHKKKCNGEQKKKKKRTKKERNASTDVLFTCAECDWKSNSHQKILLHLIHHPKQCVDESVIDVSILRKYNIVN